MFSIFIIIIDGNFKKKKNNNTIVTMLEISNWQTGRHILLICFFFYFQFNYVNLCFFIYFILFFLLCFIKEREQFSAIKIHHLLTK